MILITHLFAIVVVTVVAAVFYILATPSAATAVAKLLKGSQLAKQYDDELMRKCISDGLKLYREIKGCNNRTELEAYYWEIDHFEASYSHLVPDSLLLNHVCACYEIHVERTNEMFKKNHRMTDALLNLDYTNDFNKQR